MCNLAAGPALTGNFAGQPLLTDTQAVVQSRASRECRFATPSAPDWHWRQLWPRF